MNIALSCDFFFGSISDANSCLHRYDVSGFPTLKFFPKGNKAGEDYDGGRDLDDFVNFINEKCGTSRDTKGQLTDKVSVGTVQF